ncbi:MAG: hypothetical protein WCK21_03750 [Actinomycetota bacterium]
MERAEVTNAARTRPFVVGTAGFGAALLFVLARLRRMAGGDISKFVVAGEQFTDRTRTGGHLFVWADSGYDGQYYWRLAVDPTNLRVARAHGVVFDYPLRAGRVSYTSFVWLLSLGQQRWTAFALVAVNVLAIGALAWAGACIAVQCGRSMWFGLLAANATGLVFSLSRDCTEVVMAAGVVVGIAAIRSRKPAMAAAAWTVAVLAHEQALCVVGTYALFRLVDLVRERRKPARVDLTWAVPVAAFAAWQTIASVQVGEWPVLTSGSASVAAPFGGIARELLRAARGEVSHYDMLFVPQLAVVALMVIVVFRTHRDLTDDDRWLAGALTIGLLLSVCLSYNVWKGPADLRQMTLVPTLAGVALIVSRCRIPITLLCAVALVLLMTARVRINLL